MISNTYYLVIFSASNKATAASNDDDDFEIDDGGDSGLDGGIGTTGQKSVFEYSGEDIR